MKTNEWQELNAADRAKRAGVVRKTMSDLRDEYYAAYQRARGISYQNQYGCDIEIRGAWFILTSCNVQRKMMETMIARLNNT